MKRFFPILRFLLVAVAIVCMQCTDMGGGGTIETTNGLVTGMVVLPGGTPAARTQVKLLPTGYDLAKDTAAVPTDTTDTMGNYTIAHVYPGDYTIQAVQLDDRTRTLVSGIRIANDTVAAPACTLQAPGTIRVYLPGGINSVTGYVYIPGTTCVVFLNNHTDFVILDSVPAGVIPAVSYSSVSITTSTVIRYDVPIVPGDTAVVYNPSWKYARRLFLNTTASGANVSGDVYNFPVLVRLTAGNFTFAQAKTDGRDLRFTKNDGTPLPYEIERYDAGSSRAEIWVKTDTIYGNDGMQSITMYWGNPAAASESNGGAVFDTAAGFAGVWHLGENGDSIYDATGNAFNGKKYGSSAAPGMIGNSELFANSNYIRISGLLNRPSNVTLSAWVRSDTSAGRGQDIVSIGDAALIRFDDVNGFGTGGFYHDNPVVNDSMYGRVSSGRYLAKTGWHYLAFSINSASHVQTFYIDGVECASTQDVNPIYYAGLGTDTYIGIHGNGKTAFNFIGLIDEVRVNNNAVDPDWVKLCFMNQKAQDALIVW
ncbi:MAG: DUF2341 domain-containing protein [Chitinispirillaceae bacterium]|jgi:hypothetical protein